MHPNGLDFHNQRRVVILRDMRKPGGKKLAFAKIASMVRTLKGKRSTEQAQHRCFGKDSLDDQTQEVAQNSEGADCRQAEVSEL